jgi:hypothetical protein
LARDVFPTPIGPSTVIKGVSPICCSSFSKLPLLSMINQTVPDHISVNYLNSCAKIVIKRQIST